MKNKINSLVLALIAIFLFGCEYKAIKDFSPETDSPYKINDIVRSDLMWDTDKFFNINPEIEVVELSGLSSKYTAFKFKSVSYSIKELEYTRPFAMIGLPQQEMPKGGYPAIVLVHGGAGQVYKDWIKYWNEKGYIALALDMFGNMLDENLMKVGNFEGGPNESNSGSVNDSIINYEDSWVYHSVANIILSNNILRNRTDVAKDKIAITGISWGGFITSIVSGVDKRFAAFAPIYGGGYIYQDSFFNGNFGGKEGTEARETWISLYDPSSYLPYCTKPILFVSGIDDNCFSADNRARFTTLVKGKAFYSQRTDYQHGYFWKESYEVYAFMQHILFNLDTVINIESSYNNKSLSVQIKDGVMPESAKLVYTTSKHSDSHDWVWVTMEVGLQNGKIEIDIDKDVTAFVVEFINTSVNINFKMTTQIYLREN